MLEQEELQQESFEDPPVPKVAYESDVKRGRVSC